MLVTDGVTIAATRETAMGFLVVDARIARTGMQVYGGAELGRPEMDRVRVFRPEAAVFAPDAMSSFAHRPVTDDHPAQMVDAGTWRQHAVGMTGDTVTRDGDHVRIPFTLMDADTIAAVRAGKRELSAGYLADIDWTPGTAPDGQQYDASMGNIRGNHLAIVSRGRAGATCRIGDSWGQQQQKEPAMAENTRAVLVDGLTIHTNDQGAQVIERLQGKLADAATVAAGVATQHQAALDAAAGTLAARDAEIVTLKAAVPDAIALDALAATRVATIASVRRILGDSFDPAGKTEAAMRRAAVTKRLGDAMVAGKSDEYVSAAFDAITVETATRDPVRDALATVPGNFQDARGQADTAWSDSVSTLQNRWKGAA